MGKLRPKIVHASRYDIVMILIVL